MSDKPVDVKSQVWFPFLLTLLFVGLKLGNVIQWSWVWVLSPAWIYYSLVLLLVVVLVLLELAPYIKKGDK
jgi:hypothetical protein